MKKEFYKALLAFGTLEEMIANGRPSNAWVGQSQREKPEYGRNLMRPWTKPFNWCQRNDLKLSSSSRRENSPVFKFSTVWVGNY